MFSLSSTHVLGKEVFGGYIITRIRRHKELTGEIGKQPLETKRDGDHCRGMPSLFDGNDKRRGTKFTFSVPFGEGKETGNIRNLRPSDFEGNRQRYFTARLRYKRSPPPCRPNLRHAADAQHWERCC